MDWKTSASCLLPAVFSELDTSPAGLTTETAKKRLATSGHNEISVREHEWWEILLRQFHSSFIYLLLFAAVLSFILGERFDGLMILLFVAINAALGFYQEYKSEKTKRLLQKFVRARSTVLRDHLQTVIESSFLVPGDIVMLKAGDRVPADIRLLETHDMQVDESVLTGESVPVVKDATKVLQSPALHAVVNMVFSATAVVSGKAVGVVVAIGKETEMGAIAKLTVETTKVSSFEKGLNRFSRFILWVVGITLLFVLGLNIWVKGAQAPIGELLLFTIALSVSVIPEALPVVVTFSLSHGALLLSKKKVIVKRLSAIEDLGGIEILCTDKTGTLTENQLTVADAVATDTEKLMQLAILTTERHHKVAQVEPFDKALVAYGHHIQHKRIAGSKILDQLPFDPIRRRNSLLVQEGVHKKLIVRGAPEVVWDLCRLTAFERKKYTAWVHERGLSGQRVIAIAEKRITQKAVSDLEKLEKDLSFVGMFAFIDPIKSTTADSIKQAKALGLQIKILTGDSPQVAGYVGKEIGLIADERAVLTADILSKMSLDEQHAAIDAYHVFARVTPELKYKIIHILQEKHVVGFLGEGINDAPALKIANVAIAVQSASDISREAADIILLHKSLHIIVEGIRIGRETFTNTLKYIRATLASNFGNFYAVAVASLFITYLPMLPLQILLLNLLSDFPMITIATDNVDQEELVRPKRYDLREIALVSTVLGFVSTFFDFAVFGLFFTAAPAVLQTNWFVASILTELAFLFSIRTKKFVLRARLPSWGVVSLAGLAALATVVLPFTGIGRTLFSFVAPSTGQLLLVFSVVGIYFVTTESVKLIYYRLFR